MSGSMESTVIVGERIIGPNLDPTSGSTGICLPNLPVAASSTRPNCTLIWSVSTIMMDRFPQLLIGQPAQTSECNPMPFLSNGNRPSERAWLQEIGLSEPDASDFPPELHQRSAPSRRCGQ
jgi:hypothetical protein